LRVATLSFVGFIGYDEYKQCVKCGRIYSSTRVTPCLPGCYGQLRLVRHNAYLTPERILAGIGTAVVFVLGVCLIAVVLISERRQDERAGETDAAFDAIGGPAGYQRVEKYELQGVVTGTWQLACPGGRCPLDEVKAVFDWIDGLGLDGTTLESFRAACWPPKSVNSQTCDLSWNSDRYRFAWDRTTVADDGQNRTILVSLNMRRV
jgi:hypothetical protein